MKKETLTIIIGAITTLLVLGLTLFVMYKIDEGKSTKAKDQTAIKDSNKKEDQNKDDNTIPVNNNTDKNENNTSKNHKPNTNNANNKVTLYLFHGSTCPACNKAIERLKANVIGKYDYLEIKSFEVWGNKDNNKLMGKVAEALNVEAKYIPFIVIDKYSTTSSNDKEDFLKEEITASHTSSNYEDIVAKVIAENKDLNPKFEILKK